MVSYGVNFDVDWTLDTVERAVARRSGEILGEHNGLAFYTIGQRKGLGIAHTEPLYVMEKNPENNILVVGTIDELGTSA